LNAYYRPPLNPYAHHPLFPSFTLDDEPDWHGVVVLNLGSSHGSSPDDIVELYMCASDIRPDLNFQSWPRRLHLKFGSRSLFRRDGWDQDGIAAFVPDMLANTDLSTNARSFHVVTSCIDEYESIAYCPLNVPGACRGAGIVFLPGRDLRRLIGYIFWNQPIPFKRPKIPPRTWAVAPQPRQGKKRKVTFALPDEHAARYEPSEPPTKRSSFLQRMLGHSRTHSYY